MNHIARAYSTVVVLVFPLLYKNNKIPFSGCLGGPYEKELLTALLKNYNTQNRPVLNESSPIIITFGVTLQQIVDLVNFKTPFIKILMTYYLG